MVRDDGVSLAVGWIDLSDFLEPRVRGPIGEDIDRGTYSHGFQRIRRQTDGLVGLSNRLCRVRVLECEVGHHLVRLDELRIKFEGLRGPLDSLAVEAVCAHERKTEVGLRVLCISCESFLEKIFRVGIVEPFVQQATPANTNQSIAVYLSCRGTKLVVSLLVHFESPEAFGAQVRIMGKSERLVAALCLAAMAMLAQGVAVAGRGGHAQARAQQRHRRNREASGRPAHLSSSSWIRASSTSVSVSCFL